MTLLIGFADQQLNPHNPRGYNFRGALEEIRGQAHPGDTVLYSPSYLRDVIAYYSPGVRAESLDRAQKKGIPADGRVFVLGSFLSDPATADQVGAVRSQLES